MALVIDMSDCECCTPTPVEVDCLVQNGFCAGPAPVELPAILTVTLGAGATFCTGPQTFKIFYDDDLSKSRPIVCGAILEPEVFGSRTRIWYQPGPIAFGACSIREVMWFVYGGLVFCQQFRALVTHETGTDEQCCGSFVWTCDPLDVELCRSFLFDVDTEGRITE